MIKIEFKEAQTGIDNVKCLFYDHKKGSVGDWYRDDHNLIDSVTFGCPSQLVPSRTEVLKQLGITKEQDDYIQLKYSNLK